MTRLNALQPLGLLLLRITLGIIFIAHGYPKLFHPEAMHGLFAQHGVPRYIAEITAFLEVFGGGLLVAGLFTRIAALLLAIEMSFAVWKAVSNTNYLSLHSYEYPLLLATASFALATVGAGRISADHALYESGARPQRSGKPKGK
jgi:putative oxidoreductase